MTLAQFRALYPAFNRVFHFTEAANIPSINERGILSLREIKTKNILDVRFCSSPQSRLVDERNGLDQYVRLCFVDNHPMVYRAKERGELTNEVYVPIDSSILELPGVQVAAGIAYQNGVPLYPLAEAFDRLDFEVLYNWADWKDPVVCQRLLIARKYEILVPNRVEAKYILGH